MKRSLLKCSVVATLIGVLASNVMAGPVEGKKADKGSAAAVKCPVMDTPVNFLMSTETPDGPVFFCCARCIDKYKAEPEKYSSQVADQRKSLGDMPKVQVVCPVTGKKLNKKMFTEADGRKVYFCCGGCVKKFEKDPDRYQAALANSYTYQTLCPVMEKEINPSVFMETRAGKVYFCCKMCDEKLVSNPEKYLPKLEAQGIKLAATDLKTDKDGGS